MAIPTAVVVIVLSPIVSVGTGASSTIHLIVIWCQQVNEGVAGVEVYAAARLHEDSVLESDWSLLWGL